MELERLADDGVLSKRRLNIISLREQGYNYTEIADIVGISRQAIHKNMDAIQDILRENGLAIGY